MYNSAVILVAEGVQDEEFLYPYYRLKEEGLDVTVVASLYKGNTSVKGKYGIPIKYDFTSEYLSTIHPDILIIPGGWQCPEILRMDQNVLEFVRRVDKEKKIIGAICHGPQVLISAGIVKGVVISGYQGIKDDIINAGGLYSENINIDKSHSTIVTAPHYKDNPAFMKAILKQYRNLVLKEYAY